MVVPIHLLPSQIQQTAKASLHKKAPNQNLFNIPNTTGVGIGDGHIKVTVTQEHPLHSSLPKNINGIPVQIEQRPEIRHHLVQGGQAFAGRNTLFAVMQGNDGQRYLAGCAHSFAYLNGGQVVIGGQTVGQFTRSALQCGQTANHLDASIARVLPNAQTSFDIIGLGTPRGIAEPAVGQKAHMQGIAGGARVGNITTINYDFHDTYPEFAGCSVNHVDLFETNNSGIPGDSVSAETRLYWLDGENLRFGTIEDLFLSFRDGDKRSFYVLSASRRKNAFNNKDVKRFSTNTLELGFSRIKDVMFHGIKPVWRVMLRNGKSIEVTKDHSLFCAEGTVHQNFLIPKTLDNLTNVVSVDNYGFTGGERAIGLQMLLYMGLWMADGSYECDRRIKKKGCVSISTGGNPDVKNWIKGFSQKIMKVKGGGCILGGCRPNGDYRLWSVTLATKVYDMFGDVDSYTKRIPKEVFTLDEMSIRYFLRGYFSGDGSLHKRNAGYIVDCASVNRMLLDDVSVLLDRIGIKHTIDKGYARGFCWGKYQMAKQYKLRIEHGLAVNRFMALVGFVQNKQFIERTRFNDETGRPVSVRRIRSIEYVGEKPVYDVSVENENFVANGILCHNSGAAVWNDSGYVMGIHFAGSNNGSIGLQCNAKYFGPELGVTIPGGVITSHTGAAPVQQQQNITPLLLIGGAVIVGLAVLR